MVRQLLDCCMKKIYCTCWIFAVGWSKEDSVGEKDFVWHCEISFVRETANICSAIRRRCCQVGTGTAMCFTIAGDFVKAFLLRFDLETDRPVATERWQKERLNAKFKKKKKENIFETRQQRWNLKPSESVEPSKLSNSRKCRNTRIWFFFSIFDRTLWAGTGTFQRQSVRLTRVLDGKYPVPAK